MKFIADEMLGKLARWLRMKGIDVLYETRISDDRLLQLANQEDRIILTRDTRLVKRLRPDQFLFIEHNYLDDQMKQFDEKYPRLSQTGRAFTRCVECNAVLEKIPKEAVRDKVWPYVYQTQENFTTCPHCHRIYWQATHVQQIRERLKRWGFDPAPGSKNPA